MVLLWIILSLLRGVIRPYYSKLVCVEMDPDYCTSLNHSHRVKKRLKETREV